MGNAPMQVSRQPGLAQDVRTRQVIKDFGLYLMLLPGIAYFIWFKYVPIWGIVIAFQDYYPAKGVFGSNWVGLKHFIRFFHDPAFGQLLMNTSWLALYQLVFYFPIPIILALLLNELRLELFKRTVQTLVYIPHFFSWVVVAGIFVLLFNTEGGLVNELLAAAGMQKIPFLLSPEWFRPIATLQIVWKDAGWGTIIFLAALAGVDPQLYEAAKMDGASRWRQTWHITLPAIRSVIVILFILRLGNFLDSNVEQIFLMLNALNREVGEVYDTYVVEVGLRMGQFSYTTAVNLFKSAVGMIMVVGANWLAKRFGEEGIF